MPLSSRGVMPNRSVRSSNRLGPATLTEPSSSFAPLVFLLRAGYGGKLDDPGAEKDNRGGCWTSSCRGYRGDPLRERMESPAMLATTLA